MFLIPLLAGLLASLAFPPFHLLPAALLGPALLFHHLKKNARFSAGFLYGVGLLAPQLRWLSTFHVLAPYGVILVSALPYGCAAHVLRDRPQPLVAAVAFTAAEVVRSVGTFALPWGVLGSLAADLPIRILAPWIGLFGFSLLFHALAFLLAARPVVASAGILLLLFVRSAPYPPTGSAIHVGVVQGNFGQDSDYEFQPDRIVEELFRSTRELRARGATTIFWSETVILEYLNRASAMRDRIAALARETGSTIVVGAPGIVTATDKRNSAFVFAPDGSDPAGRYDKFHLVPFGEFLPCKGPDLDHVLLPRGTGDFTPAILPRPLGSWGMLVCYEGVFPYLSRALVLDGATALVNISNDAWARDAASAEQHAALAQLRAAEFNRPFVRAGNVGPSYIIDATGAVLAKLPAGVGGIVECEIHPVSCATASALFGDWIGWSCLLGLPFVLTVQSLLVEV